MNKKMGLVSRPTYLFGAHVFAQYLIAFCLETRQIICLLDNDSNKQRRRLYGTDLTVRSPKTLRALNNPVVILKAGVYNNEIKEDIVQKINPDVDFWE